MKNQKLGILDVLTEMNDDTKIDIELQVKMSRFWDKRQLFYLSKLYTSELRFGEDYDRLKAGTKNAGILEAVKELKLLNLRGKLRAHYELYLKARRDRRAQDAYEREEGRREGYTEGCAAGHAEGYVEGRMEMLVAISMEEGKSREETVRKLKQVFAISEEEAERYFDKYAVK